jgi:O-antigen/teichoic acid export membrane protein
MTIGQEEHRLHSVTRTISNTVVLFATSYLGGAVALLFSIVLARLLEPEHFGVIALAGFYFSLVGRIKEWGFDAALLVRQDDLEAACFTHFILQVGLSILCVGLIGIALPLLPGVLSRESRIALMILAVTGVAQSATTTFRTVLEKQLKMQAMSLLEFFTGVVAAAVAILMAYRGYGLWSLLVRHMLQGALNLFGIAWLCPWRLTGRWNKKLARWYFTTYGFPIWLGGWFSLLTYQFDDFLVGTFITVENLGYYSRAFNLSLLPIGFTWVLTKSVAPLYATMYQSRDELQRIFNMLQAYKVRMFLPVFAVLFVAAEEFIGLLLGSKWLPTAPILRIFVFYAFIRLLFEDCASLTTIGMGQPRIFLGVQILQGLIMLAAGPLLTIRVGVYGAAAAMTLMMLAGFGYVWWRIGGYIRIDLMKIFFLPVMAAVVASVAGYLAGKALDAGQWAWRLVVAGGVVLVVYLGILASREWHDLRRDLVFCWNATRVGLGR